MALMIESGTVLVTGGAGYIGSHTVRALRETSCDVVVLDTLALGDANAVLGAPLVQGDIADRELVGSVLRDYGVTDVIHFAAYKSVGESMESPGKYWRNNVTGTIELLEACRDAGVERFVFSSSCSVYGTPERVPVTESAVIQPESVYAETKATVERMLRWHEVTDGLRSVSLRYFNAAGASSDGRIGEDWNYSINLIPLAMKAVLLGDRRLQVFGADYDTPDGTCIRDYIHVEDLADAHVKALEYLGRGWIDGGGQRWHRRGLVRVRRDERYRAGVRSTCASRRCRPAPRRPGDDVRRSGQGRQGARLDGNEGSR